jgi:hypothetical protein
MPVPAADSYGTIDGVAALAKTWTRDGTFIDTEAYVEGTNPDNLTVVHWIDQISAMLNTALAKHGFKVPLTTDRSKLVAQSIVEQLTADLVKYVNNQGRFFSQRYLDSGQSVWRTVRNDLDLWVLEFSAGLAEAGEIQGTTNIDEVGFRNTDESGDLTFPIFQRSAFGNRFQDWDKGT